MLIVNPTTKLTTNRCNNGNNDNNDNIRAGVISDAGGGAETRFQPTVALASINLIITILCHSQLDIFI